MRQLLIVSVFAVIAQGCAATSPYMIPKKGGTLGAASGDKAQVVFVRPSSFAKGIACAILDADGTYLGEAVPAAYFPVTLKPGSHTFVAWSEGTHAMKADLAPGKTYYVEVSPSMGVWSARFHLKAIRKGTPEYDQVKEWLAESTMHEVKLSEGQKEIVDARKADADETIKKGVARFAEYNAEEAKERTLTVADGS
jgi:hypothetical protein